MIDEQRPVGRAATTEDVAAVTACLTSAFFSDPLWGLWTFPDEANRARGLTAMMHLWTAAGVRRPWVRMTPAAEAVALWVPPGEPEFTAQEEHEFEALIDQLLGDRAAALHGLLEDFDEHHPREPHFYLSLWAVHRDHAGRGLGSELIRENLARVDGTHMPAYLESTNPANLPRYEALGFERRGEFGPSGGPVITTMWRDPR